MILRVIKNGQEPEEKKRFIDLFREFNRQDAVENDHSPGTVYKYDNITDNFERYLEATGQPDLSVTDYSMQTLKYFALWLPENLKSCNRTHIAKHVSRVNKAANYAVCMGIIPFNPSAAFKVKRAKNKPVIHLEDEEFLTWINARWHLDIYRKAQDNYTFMMVTGLSYGDLFNYKTTLDKNTGIWIDGLRNKTGRPYFIPLFHQDFRLALDIHLKYNGQLPYIENHFFNRLIREMAAQLGIDKYLKTHTGRKTFATLAHQNGYEVPEIAAILGNTDKVCETDYIGLGKRKIIKAMARRTARTA